MELNDIDYDNSPMSAIRLAEISRLDALLFTMEKLSKLCDRDAERVAVEFDFKGSFKAVKDQLIKTLDRYALKGIQATERFTLNLNESRITKWLTETKKEDKSYSTLIKKALANQDVTRLGQVAHGITGHTHTLHSKKECICFINTGR
jgi:hypothetical protein